MPTPLDDRRTRLRAALRELKASAAALPGLIGAFEERLAEQENALNAALHEADHARHEKERTVAAHAAQLAAAHRAAAQSTQAADDNAAAVAEAEREFERERAVFIAERDLLTARLREAEEATVRLRADVDRLAAVREPESTAPREALPEAPSSRRKTSAKPTSAGKKPTSPKAPRAPRKPAPAPPASAPRTAPTPETPASGPLETAIAEAFRAWCAEASPVVGKVEFFAGRVRQAVPGASVAAVYRDANSQAQPVVFRTSGGSSPVEHWLVVADGRHWLLPQPLGGAQFRELAPCFEGTAAPASLVRIRPAEVRAVGDQFELARPGEVA